MQKVEMKTKLWKKKVQNLKNPKELTKAVIAIRKVW